MNTDVEDGKTPARKIGRPGKFTKALARDICARLEGGESLLDICRDPAMPARSTVNRWLSENKEFSDNYARAHDIHNDDEFDGMADLDRMLLEGKIKADVHRSLIDSRKWRIAKRNPRKYGDKLDVDAKVTVNLADIVNELEDES